MASPAEGQPRIDDPDFRHAVELIDQGDASALRTWIDQHPALLTAHAEEDGTFAGDYFKRPRLLWFVAENPIRNGQLPNSIAAVTQELIEASRRHDVVDLHDVLNYTLSLVTSGAVAKESGQLRPLVKLLAAAGANLSGSLDTALAHANRDAAEILLEFGGQLHLGAAAALGREKELQRLRNGASPADMQRALALAAINGQSRMTRILVDCGADPNRYCPKGMHAHSTPLHQAVAAQSTSTICTLMTRGAKSTLRDRMFGGTALGWSEHFPSQEVRDFLVEARAYVPAIEAIRAGDTVMLRLWLDRNPSKVNQTLGDNPRTLLHYATDWPGHFPNVGDTIRLLLERGADPTSRHDGPAVPHKETPLHWAASSNDVAALDALIDGGAPLDPIGGCLDNGTPLVLATLFEQYAAAKRLIERGAQFNLSCAAACGRMDLVERFFDDQGKFSKEIPSMPNRDNHKNPQGEIDSGLMLACRAGYGEIAEYLLGRGANINAVSVIHKTSLDYAREGGFAKLASMLESAGAVSANKAR